jgi:hypothetical protein
MNQLNQKESKSKPPIQKEKAEHLEKETTHSKEQEPDILLAININKEPRLLSWRPLFSDNINSFVHLTCGVLSVRFRWLLVFFMLYQLLDPYDDNMHIDILEFLFGYIIGLLY